jgi:PTS system galactitol-specific IIA component
MSTRKGTEQAMEAASLFDEKTVLVGVDEPSREQVLTKLTQLLIENGYAQLGYLEAVLAREHAFPTGLPTEPVGVAIPHGTASCVLKSGVAVGVLAQPIDFQEMGSPANTLKVKVVFVLAIREAESQTKVLSQLMELFQKRGLLERISRAQDAQSIVELLKDNMNGAIR